MTEPEKKLKKKVQLIVGFAMTFLFVLVTVITFQFAVRINQRVMEANLNKESARLAQELSNAQNDIYYMTEEYEKFLEEYALKVLGWGKEGQPLFGK